MVLKHGCLFSTHSGKIRGGKRLIQTMHGWPDVEVASQRGKTPRKNLKCGKKLRTKAVVLVVEDDIKI